LGIPCRNARLREIADHQPAVADRVARDIVAAAAHRHQQAVISGKIHGGNHISGSGAAGNNGGPVADHRVVDLARGFIPIVAPKQMATTQSAMELLDHI